MIAFLNPWFLLAGAAALVPLVLHLMQKSRTIQIPFSTIRFLKLADQRSSRRIRMENLLLWLLRTLLMLLLAMAFAMPMLRTTGFGRLLGQAQRDVAIVIDASYSMLYQTGRDTVWDKTIATAIAILEGLSEQDQFCIYLADDEVTPLVEQLSGDRQDAIDRLRAATPAYTSSGLAPAVLAANSALQQEKRRREREIFILTDRQKLPWNSFGPDTTSGGAALTPDDKGEPAASTRTGTGAGEGTPAPDGGPAANERWNPSRIPDRTAVFVVLMGVPAPENAAPVDVELNPHLLMADVPSRVEADLAHSGPPRDTAVALSLDGEEVARRSAVLGEEVAARLAFAVPAVGPGPHAAWVETPEDNLPVDSRFYFLIKAREKLPSLCVGTADDTFFLRAALNAGRGSQSAIDLKHTVPEQLPEEDLRAYTCIFLCNSIPLPGQEVIRLEDYVRQGGLLVVFPGNRATPQAYAAFQCLPGIPSRVADLPLASRNQVLRWDKPRHPLIRTLDMGAAAPLITIRRHLTWTQLDEQAETLVSSGAEHPFLLSRPFGKGRTILFSVPADRSWSDFPLSPFFLPIAHLIVEFGAGVGTFSNYHWVSRSAFSLEEHLPEATRESILLDPDGKRVPLRSAVVDGETVLHAEGLPIPGIYRLSLTADADPVPALAVNVRRTESNLTPIDEAEITRRLGLEHVQVSTNREQMDHAVEEHRIGRTFGELILWLALIVAAAEFAYANRLSQSGLGLSKTMRVDMSGRVAAGKSGN